MPVLDDLALVRILPQHPCPCALLPQGARWDPGISELVVTYPGAPGGLAKRNVNECCSSLSRYTLIYTSYTLIYTSYDVACDSHIFTEPLALEKVY